MALSAAMNESRSRACNCDGVARAAEYKSEDIASDERARIMRTVGDDARARESQPEGDGEVFFVSRLKTRFYSQ